VSIKALADQHAANVLPVIREIRRAGASSLHQIAEALNARGITTVRVIRSKCVSARVTPGVTLGLVGLSSGACL
jgi:hypothetical protein